MDQTIPSYAGAVANYARSSDPDAFGARVINVRYESPAYDVGIEPNMRVLAVNGKKLTDMIVWLWEADSETVDLTVFDPSDATTAEVTLERFPGEDWGIEFDGPIFDGMRTCVNACIFCFMAMLPKGGRDTLYIRDDDYRLSFLQGNFVTLTNMTEDDVANVIEHDMSPMNVSIHAISPGIRKKMMGRNASRGIEALEALMAANIEIHAQIVLCPGINDGTELKKTLDYCESHEQITSLGIVPLGFTKHQKRFSSSYSDDPIAAKAVIDLVRPYQDRAFKRFGRHTFQMSDEFYLAARIDPPEASFYDGYPQYYDGIGMVRSYMDDTARIRQDEMERLRACSTALSQTDLRLMVVSGNAAQSCVSDFIEKDPLRGSVIAIENRYFGGNVNVTGLICACDLLDQVPKDLHNVMLFVPSIMFNADGLTLDGYHRDQLSVELEKRGAIVRIVSTMPEDLLADLEKELGLS